MALFSFQNNPRVFINGEKVDFDFSGNFRLDSGIGRNVMSLTLYNALGDIKENSVVVLRNYSNVLFEGVVEKIRKSQEMTGFNLNLDVYLKQFIPKRNIPAGTALADVLPTKTQYILKNDYKFSLGVKNENIANYIAKKEDLGQVTRDPVSGYFVYGNPETKSPRIQVLTQKDSNDSVIFDVVSSAKIIPGFAFSYETKTYYVTQVSCNFGTREGLVYALYCQDRTVLSTSKEDDSFKTKFEGF